VKTWFQSLLSQWVNLYRYTSGEAKLTIEQRFAEASKLSEAGEGDGSGATATGDEVGGCTGRESSVPVA
jgi:hypothetical protein